MPIKHRIYGLDTLRSAAIVLVLMYHYVVFVGQEPLFGIFSEVGWIGGDLFFVLSGYLIGHQIFFSLVNQGTFSLKNFYYRRLLRTLPNYLFILSIYFLIPGFRERELLPPLWKFLTFTQNFNPIAGKAFSHAWSLCIEEQFYLIFPALTLVIVAMKAFRTGWMLIGWLLIAGIILRGSLWIYYAPNTEDYFIHAYYSKIYYSTFCRLDELILGVSIALLRNFHQEIWTKMMKHGNLILLFGMTSSSISCYLFFHYHYSFLMTALGYPLLAISFTALTIAALSPTSYLHQIKIPGAAQLALWSYAIYLVHKPLMVLTDKALLNLGITHSSLTALFTIGVSIFGGWVLYVCVEVPFLKFRDRAAAKTQFVPSVSF